MIKHSAIGNSVKQYRKYLGLTQAELADKYGCSTDSVARWEHGETRPPMKILEKIMRGIRKAVWLK